jgi:hypothetical protein
VAVADQEAILVLMELSLLPEMVAQVQLQH